jgi:hypothetical protein
MFIEYISIEVMRIVEQKQETKIQVHIYLKKVQINKNQIIVKIKKA